MPAPSVTKDAWLGAGARTDRVLPQETIAHLVAQTKVAAGPVAKARAMLPGVRQMLTRLGATGVNRPSAEGRITMGDYDAMEDASAFVAVPLETERGLMAEFSGREAATRRDGSRLFAADGPALDPLLAGLTQTTPPAELEARFTPEAVPEQASDTQLLALMVPAQVFAAFPRVYPRRMGEAPRLLHCVCGVMPDPGLSRVDAALLAAGSDAGLWRLAAAWHLALHALRQAQCDAVVLVDAYGPDGDPQTSGTAARALGFVLRTHFADAFRLVLLCPPGAERFAAAADALELDDAKGALPGRVGVLCDQDALGVAAELCTLRTERGLLRVGLFVPTNWRALRCGCVGMDWNAPSAAPTPTAVLALSTSLLLAHRDLGAPWWRSPPERVAGPFAGIDLRRPLPFPAPGRTGRPPAADAPPAVPLPARRQGACPAKPRTAPDRRRRPRATADDAAQPRPPRAETGNRRPAAAEGPGQGAKRRR